MHFLEYGRSGLWWDLEGGCKQKMETCLLFLSPLVQRKTPKQYCEPSGNCTVLIYSYVSVEEKKNSFFSVASCQNAKCRLFLTFSATVK